MAKSMAGRGETPALYRVGTVLVFAGLLEVALIVGVHYGALVEGSEEPLTSPKAFASAAVMLAGGVLRVISGYGPIPGLQLSDLYPGKVVRPAESPGRRVVKPIDPTRPPAVIRRQSKDVQ